LSAKCAKYFGVKKSKTFGGYPMPDLGKNLDVATDPDGPIGGGRYQGGGREYEPLTDDDNDADTFLVGDGGDTGASGEPTDLLERLRDAMKGNQMRDPIKKLDAVEICKVMVKEDRPFGISEHELVNLIDKYAQAHGTTFAKLFSANDDTALALRKAVDICKNAQFTSRTATLSKAATLAPRQVVGRDAQAVNDPKSVLDQLKALAQ
jgi:hypothetical protein